MINKKCYFYLHSTVTMINKSAFNCKFHQSKHMMRKSSSWVFNGSWKNSESSWVLIGSWALLGSWILIRSWALIGSWVLIGSCVLLGSWVHLGSWVLLRSWVLLGSWVLIGPWVPFFRYAYHFFSTIYLKEIKKDNFER